MPIYEASERVLRAFQDELMPAESLSEIFDVVGQYANAACQRSLAATEARTVQVLMLFVF